MSLVEAFSYLGAAFVLAAWGALIGRVSGQAAGATRDWLLVAGMAVPAAVFFVIGLVLHGRSARLSRAAGVAFLVSVGFVASGVDAQRRDRGRRRGDESSRAPWPASPRRLAYRWYHPAVLTEVALLAAITAVVQASLGCSPSGSTRLGAAFGGSFGAFDIRGPSSRSLAWLACAVLIGLIALLEARTGSRGRRPASGARPILGGYRRRSPAWRRPSCGPTFDGAGIAHRVIEPWIADVIVLAVSAVLVERAFRRESAAYVVAAALGVVVALTDFNATYVAPTSGIEIALLVEGLLLIGIALGAERIRRRVRDSPPSEPGGDVGPPPPGEADSSPDGQAEAVSG